MEDKLPNQVDMHQLSILKEKQKFNLQYQYEKILGFCPMFNKTCVILAIKSHCLQCVAHIDQNGKILKQIMFRESNFYDFIITSDHEIVWLDIDRNFILQWNVQTYKLLQFPFQFKDDNVCPTHQIFVFPQTQMFFIAQWGPINSNIFKITYLCYPLLTESKPVHCFESQQVWTYQHRISRANMSSKLLWFIGKTFEGFRAYEVEKLEQNKYAGKYTQFKINIDITKANIVVNSIWEISFQKYLLITTVDQSGLKPEQKINPFLIYEENEKNEENTKKLRQANFKISAQQQYKIVDCYCYGETTMIRTFKLKQTKAEESAIYYINNNCEKICGLDSWRCTNLNKYTFPAHNSNLLIDAEYRNGDVKQIQSNSILIISPCCVTAHLLISIIDEPCEDLIAHVLLLIYGFY